MESTVGMGEIMVAESPDLLRAVGIGSCVAVTLYDSDNAIGALAHIVLPCIDEAHNKSNPARFSDFAIGMMIEKMQTQGAHIQDIRAKIFGGANMFPEIIPSDSTMNIGRRNISAVKEELEKHNIQIVAEGVGDHIGCSVLFNTEDGSIVVQTAHDGEKKY